MLILSIYLYKSIISPPAVLNFVWMLCLFNLSISNDHDKTYEFTYVFLLIGLVIFNLSFFVLYNLSNKLKRNKIQPLNKFNLEEVNYKFIIITLFFEFLISIICILVISNYAINNFNQNFYFTLKLANNNNDLPFINLLKYILNFSIVFTLYIQFLLLKGQMKSKKLYYIQFIISFSLSIFSLGRTSILLLVISSIFLYLSLRNVKNHKIIFNLIFFGIVGMILFSGYNYLKYPYLFETTSKIKTFADLLTLYTSGSILAFQQWVSNYPFENLDYGKNTFRFIYAVFDSIGYDVKVNELTNEFVTLNNGLSSNVYTIYYFYAKDFGLTFSLVVISIVGSIHGVLYSNHFSQKKIWVILYSLSIYPLIMQFFQDQYISLLSTWIQFIVYTFLINRYILKKTTIKSNEILELS